MTYPAGQRIPYKFEAAERRLGFTGKWDTDLLHAPWYVSRRHAGCAAQRACAAGKAEINRRVGVLSRRWTN